MSDIKLPFSPKAIGLGVAVGLLGFWLLSRHSRAIAAGAAGAVIDAADGILTGTVVTIGEKLGVPETSVRTCEAAMQNGQKMAASQYCPAGRFIRWIFAGMPATGVPE